MSTPDNPTGMMPLQSLEIRNLLPQTTATENLLRCIGCIVSRADEGETINIPTIQACTGIAQQALFKEMRRLEKADLVEPLTPDNKVIKPALGQGNILKTRLLQPTRLGAELLQPEPQPDCPMRSPFARLYPVQERVVRCIRCALARTENAEEPTAGGVFIAEVVQCQDISPVSVRKVFNYLVREELLKRKSVPKTEWGKGTSPHLYQATDEGMKWLAPESAENCPTLKKSEPPRLKGLTPRQKKILGCAACIQGSENSGCSQEVTIRPKTISVCQDIHPTTVKTTLRKLKGEGYLNAVPFPEGEKTSHYTATVSGERLLRSIRATEECPSGRVRVRRDLKTSFDAKEIDDLAKRAPDPIINDLPSKTFENGAQLLEYLNTAYYGNITYINLVMQALSNVRRKNLLASSCIEIDDIIQDVFIELGRREKQITFPDDMPLIHVITSRKIIDVRRRQTRGDNRNISLDAPDNPEAIHLVGDHFEDDVISQLDAQRGHKAIRALIDSLNLPEIDQAILETIMLGSEDTDDPRMTSTIAKKFGTTRGNVRIRTFRLLKRLKAKMEEDENIRAMLEEKD